MSFHTLSTVSTRYVKSQAKYSHSTSLVLPKGTTGTLAVACSAAMARELSQQFQNGTVEKTYLALVRGGRKSFPCNSGRINAPIQYTDGRATLDLLQDCKPSITEWELVDSSVSCNFIYEVLLPILSEAYRPFISPSFQAPYW